MKFGAKGFKISASGRPAVQRWVARNVITTDGCLAHASVDIDYGTAIAATQYAIGIKCWIFKGEVLDDAAAAQARR